MSRRTEALARRVDLLGLAHGVLVIVVFLLVILLSAVALRRLSGTVAQKRRDRLSASLRPLLLAVLTDEDPDRPSVRTLASLSKRRWRALEPVLVAMLGKVRGVSRDALVDVLDSRGTLQRAKRRTGSRSLIARFRAAEMLGAARRSDALPSLIALLDDKAPDVRRVAVRSLGRVASPAAAGPLLHSLSGPQPTSPREVASALVLLEPAATPVLIELTAQAVSRAESQVGLEPGSESDPVDELTVAAEVLGLRGAVGACPLLVTMLGSSQSTELQVRAARALGRIGAPSAVQPLSVALRSPVAELRAVAARALGQLGARSAADGLGEALSDPQHQVAANAAEALCLLGDSGNRVLLGYRLEGGRAAAHAQAAMARTALGAAVDTAA